MLKALFVRLDQLENCCLLPAVFVFPGSDAWEVRFNVDADLAVNWPGRTTDHGVQLNSST